eukprot:TRINITY_DN8481_c0_g1_i3.p1 TRINITY_DN8481_c0_g1~~TRINITY_DN8481_c0_g1_i3.p1  ORF type:complete len:237 (+),score=68.06 TRINITY_DN8481_c0_g1_i3:75-785(+)
MADPAEDALIAAAAVHPLEAEDPGRHPRVARVAESGSLGGSGPKVTVSGMRDLLRRRAFQPTAPDPVAAFKELTETWVAEFGLELSSEDLEQLENPEQAILSQGGFVWVALSGYEPIGCAALLKRTVPKQASDEAALVSWELTKLAVKPTMRRKGVATRIFETIQRQLTELASSLAAADSNDERTDGQLYAEVPQQVALAGGAQAFLKKLHFEELPSDKPEALQMVRKVLASAAVA